MGIGTRHANRNESHKTGEAREASVVQMMDILIGGIPRSGTTALARAVELHPDVFCWSGETALLPFVDELSHGVRLRLANLPGATQMLSRHLRSAIIDQSEWRRIEGGVNPPANITIEEVEQLGHDILLLL